MADKSIKEFSLVIKKDSDVITFPDQPIASGNKWVIKNMGAADIDNGDNISSYYILKFGSEILRVISLTGSTIDVPLNIEVTGDSVKELAIERVNASNDDKIMPVWITAYERG